MKKIRLMAVLTLLSVCAGAFAQFTNSSSSSARSTNTDGWSSFWVQYNPSTFKTDVTGVDDEDFTGISIGYSKAFSISQNMPLYIEAGLGLQYSFYTNDDGEWSGLEDEEVKDWRKEGLADPKEKFNMFSAKIPINLTYKFDLENSNISLLPFAGLNLRYNISGKYKTEWNLSSELEDFIEDYEYEDYFKDEEVDLFDKKDMGSKDATWKRFQIGWQIGLNAHIGENFILGASYGQDFSEICKKCKISTISVNLGYKF